MIASFWLRTSAVMLLLAGAVAACKSSPPAQGADTSRPAPPPQDTQPAVADSTARPDSVPSATPDTTPRRAATLADLRAEVMRMIANLNASDASRCRSIPFGAKPCGGPRQYLVYSATNTDSTALAALVARYNALDREENQKGGQMSDCSVVPQPTITLVGGRCVAAP